MRTYYSAEVKVAARAVDVLPQVVHDGRVGRDGKVGRLVIGTRCHIPRSAERQS